jgi:HEAT repeat protein
VTTRRIILIVLAVLLVGSIGNFIVNGVRTRSELARISGKDPAQQEAGVRNLMARGVLFDALQGGAPPATRLAAIAALGRIAEGGKDPAAFKELLQMLKDPDTESAEKKTHPVRDAAKDMVAKVGVGYPDLLVPAANDPDANIKAQSQAALKVIGAPLQNQMAEKLGDGGLRAPLGDILSGIGPQTIPLITPYLKEPLLKPEDSGAKIQLIEIMGKFKTAEAATAIIPFANDADPNVRRSVVTSLANIGDPAGAPVLIAALKDTSTDASARAAAAGALGAIGTPEANSAMGTALTDYDLSVASAAAAGLRRAGDSAQTVISQALTSTNSYVRTRAAEAAGGLSSPALAVRALTSDTDPVVRSAAARSVGDILVARKTADAAALTPLLNALSDKDGTVASVAAQQLGRVGLPAVAPLSARLASSDDTVAYYASQALGGVGKPAVDNLLVMAQPGKPAARWAAITLGNIGDPRAVASLEALTSSPDADTAYAATSALAKVRPG